jgi:hypothetical protein
MLDPAAGDVMVVAGTGLLAPPEIEVVEESVVRVDEQVAVDVGGSRTVM